jgi:hypothetical protein
MKGGDNMTDFLDGISGFLTADEEAELNKQFIKDNFCPFDEDPLTYGYERAGFLDEDID